jgi:hypothetical protein
MTKIPLFLLADAEWITLAFLIVLTVIVLIALILKKRSTDPKEPDTKSVPLPAEPDAQVVVNPTKANDPEGAVLVYRKEGVLVYNGTQISLDQIVDAFVVNANDNPYIPAAYHIQLNMEKGKAARIPVGMDAEWANEALKQLQEAIDRK